MILAVEPSRSQLSSRQLTIVQLLYNTSTCFVYQIFDNKLSKPAALKLLIHPTTFNPEILQREIVNQWKTQHPNIVQLYDYFWYALDKDYWVGAIETELMSMDVGKAIQNRNKNHYPWSESDLLDFLKSMIDALAYAQGLNIAHRDIKPANIFCHQSTYKIGDFGSSKEIVGATQMISISGTESFLSPILRRFTNDKYVVHNPYKSDVFSLGLTLLNMALLASLPPFGDLETLINTAIDSLRYSDNMKNWLRWLLIIEEADRPDFVSIKNYFNQIANSPSFPEKSLRGMAIQQCQHIKSNPDQPTVTPKCGHVLCRNCAFVEKQSLNRALHVVCSVCNSTFEYVIISNLPREKSIRRERREAERCDGCSCSDSELVLIEESEFTGKFCNECAQVVYDGIERALFSMVSSQTMRRIREMEQ